MPASLNFPFQYSLSLRQQCSTSVDLNGTPTTLALAPIVTERLNSGGSRLSWKKPNSRR